MEIIGSNQVSVTKDISVNTRAFSGTYPAISTKPSLDE
jgi:hypothetical protein